MYGRRFQYAYRHSTGTQCGWVPGCPCCMVCIMHSASNSCMHESGFLVQSIQSSGPAQAQPACKIQSCRYINKTYDYTACTGTSFCGCGVCHNYEAAEYICNESVIVINILYEYSCIRILLPYYMHSAQADRRRQYSRSSGYRVYCTRIQPE